MQKSLRPNNFNQFIGQQKLKNTLKVMIQSSKARNTQLDHLLFYGPPGLGKTSLANIISNEIKSNIRFAQGPLLEKKSDLLALLGSVSTNEIIFIDEIHGLNKNIEEMLYSVLEDGVIDINIGPEEESKIVRLKIPSFTLIGATTKYNKISQPLTNRFGLVAKFKNYSIKEIKKIILNSSKRLKFEINDEALELISENSKKVPRIANNFLKRCIDFAISLNSEIINKKIVNKTFDSIGIYKFGLLESHIDYLIILNKELKGKYAAIETIASLLFETKNNIEINIEPSLLSLGFIIKNSQGRKITLKGINYIENYNLKK